MLLYEEITKEIINAAYEVHRLLGFGYLEKVYENAMMKEMEYRKINCEQQAALEVYYKDHIIGKYIADIIVDNKIIIEIKANKNIDEQHFAQLLNYLKTTKKRLGLIINFGSTSLQIKRIIN